MKRIGDIIQCDRCKRQDVEPEDDNHPNYVGAKSYVLINQKRRSGGPILDLCFYCRMKVEDFARGIDYS